jgi:hypothetical protein
MRACVLVSGHHDDFPCRAHARRDWIDIFDLTERSAQPNGDYASGLYLAVVETPREVIFCCSGALGALSEKNPCYADQETKEDG